MGNQHYKTVIVTGIVSDPPEPDEALCLVHQQALALFEDGLVSPISPTGHNFVASFAVFPTGSCVGREGQKHHESAVNVFDGILQKSSLDYVIVEWGNNVAAPRIVSSHDA